MTIFRFGRELLVRRRSDELDFFDADLEAACLDATGHFSVLEDQPIAFDEEWDLQSDVTDFAKSVRRMERSARTALAYAREAEVFVRYLGEVRGKGIAEACEDDFWAYKAYRTDGPLSVRVQPTTWNRICAALLRLGRFRKIQFDDLRWRNFRASREEDGSRIRIVSLDRFIRFRDQGFAGRHQQRNAAFAELGVTTGMRCMENTAVLRLEVPSAESFGTDRSVGFTLPAPITKRFKSREVRLSKRVVREHLSPYIREDRAHQVELAIQQYFPKRVYRNTKLSSLDDFIFFEAVRPGKISILSRDHQAGVVPLAVLTPKERAKLIEVKPSGPNRFEIVDLGPLWISQSGEGMRSSSWPSIFTKACDRLGDGTYITPLVLRHVFAVHQLQFSLLGLLDIRRRRGRLDRRGEVYDRIVGDPLRTLQRLLGHADIKSTYKYLRFMEDHQELVERAFEAWDSHLARAEHV